MTRRKPQSAIQKKRLSAPISATASISISTIPSAISTASRRSTFRASAPSPPLRLLNPMEKRIPLSIMLRCRSLCSATRKTTNSARAAVQTAPRSSTAAKAIPESRLQTNSTAARAPMHSSTFSATAKIRSATPKTARLLRLTTRMT